METTAASLSGAMANTLGDLLDSAAVIGRMESSLAAHKAELVDQARQWNELTSDSPFAQREFVAEVACALRIPERTAETFIADSRALVHDLPATFAALGTGSISWRHARVVVDHASSLPPQLVARFEAAVLPFAASLTGAQFERRARHERERLEPATIDERHEQAAEKRFVEVQPHHDGMAWLTAYLPVVTAQGIYNRVTDIALAQASKDEPRTLAQRRADALAELLLDGTLDSGRDAGIRPRVLVTVPVLTLLGHSDEPASLEGFGPIDRQTALELCAIAPSFTRLLTHPETGAVLSVGRTRYAVPADLRTWLRVRDGTCRFPGCSRSARNCDIDHTRDWQFGSPTDHDNLAHLCPSHHQLKHESNWTVRQHTGGVLEWMSPTGRSYTTQPETHIRV